jgi:hypothetical protein
MSLRKLTKTNAVCLISTVLATVAFWYVTGHILFYFDPFD